MNVVARGLTLKKMQIRYAPLRASSAGKMPGA